MNNKEYQYYKEFLKSILYNSINKKIDLEFLENFVKNTHRIPNKLFQLLIILLDLDIPILNYEKWGVNSIRISNFDYYKIENEYYMIRFSDDNFSLDLVKSNYVSYKIPEEIIDNSKLKNKDDILRLNIELLNTNFYKWQYEYLSTILKTLQKI